MNIEQAIRDYLPEVIHMSLATSKDNKPWVCEVHFPYDQDLNIYFSSLTSRRHSQEIAVNPNVAGNIVTQHVEGQKVRGVYFEGKAELLKNVTSTYSAFLSLQERFGLDEEDLQEAGEENGHHFYKISVETFYLFDSRESKPSQKYELNWG